MFELGDESMSKIKKGLRRADMVRREFVDDQMLLVFALAFAIGLAVGVAIFCFLKIFGGY